MADINIGAISEALNNKADLDFNNMDPSDLSKETIVGWGMPDYSAGVSVTLPYTANNKCFVVGYASASNQAISFMINGEVVSTNGGTNATYYTRTGFYLNTGDVLSCTITGATGVVYPLKGVN